MSQTKPQLIVFKRFECLVCCVVFQVWLGCYSEHNTWMGKTAAEQQIKLDKLIQSRVANDFPSLSCEHLIVEYQNIGPKDVNLWIFQEEIHLHLKSFLDTYVVRIHTCNKICTHLICNLQTSIQSFWQATVLTKSIDCNTLSI